MQRLPGLDILRGIAALIVVFYHCASYTISEGVFPRGYLAVEFFFCLSGYVMARTYEHRFPSTLDFTLARYKRFAPVMAIGAAIGFFSLLGNQPLWFAALAAISAVFFIPTPGAGTPFPANAPTWSIQVEILCNLLHALILKRIHWIGLLLISFAIAGWMASMGLGPDAETKVSFALLRGLISYCIGIALFRLDAILPKLPFVIAPVILLAASMTSGAEWLFVLFGFPLAVLAGRRTSLSFDALGAMSFPLYAVHAPVLTLAVNNGVSVYLAAALSIMLALAIAYHAKIAGIVKSRKVLTS